MGESVRNSALVLDFGQHVQAEVLDRAVIVNIRKNFCAINLRLGRFSVTGECFFGAVKMEVRADLRQLS
jgi:hypothetical protein